MFRVNAFSRRQVLVLAVTSRYMTIQCFHRLKRFLAVRAVYIFEFPHFSFPYFGLNRPNRRLLRPDLHRQLFAQDQLFSAFQFVVKCWVIFEGLYVLLFLRRLELAELRIAVHLNFIIFI